MQCNTIQYSTIQYSTIQYNTIHYNKIKYTTIQYNTIHSTIQYTVQYNTIQYTTIQYRPVIAPWLGQLGSSFWICCCISLSVSSGIKSAILYADYIFVYELIIYKT